MSSPDDPPDRSGVSRRDYLIGSALGVGAMSGLAEALNTGGDDVLEVGDVALSSPTNVAGDLYIGPEAAVTGANPEIAPAAGRVYIARDTEVQYTADGANWKLMSVGSAQTQVPDGYFDALQTGNIGLGSVTGDGIPAQAIEHGKVWADDGKLYDTVQAAENAATDYVFIGPGTFNEDVTVDTPDLKIVGSGRATLIDGGTDGDALIVNNVGRVIISDLRVQTTAGAGNSFSGIVFADGNVTGCVARNVYCTESDEHAIRIAALATNCLVYGCVCPSGSIDFQSYKIQGDNNVVDASIGDTDVVGSNNVIGDVA